MSRKQQCVLDPLLHECYIEWGLLQVSYAEKCDGVLSVMGKILVLESP